jgi:hypothetical protein
MASLILLDLPNNRENDQWMDPYRELYRETAQSVVANMYGASVYSINDEFQRVISGSISEVAHFAFRDGKYHGLALPRSGESRYAMILELKSKRKEKGINIIPYGVITAIYVPVSQPSANDESECTFFHLTLCNGANPFHWQPPSWILCLFIPNHCL